MSRRILITGGAGFIGCHLATHLVRRGDSVDLLDNLHSQVHPGPGLPELLPEGARLLPGDVTVAGSWDAILRLSAPDVVVHLAAETGTGQSLTEASRHASVNVVGTTQLLDALFRNDVRPAHLVLASSRAVYGDGPWRDADGSVHHPPGRTHEALEAGRWDPVDEAGRPMEPLPAVAGQTPARPTNVYAATKLAQEHVLEAWTSAFGVDLSVLRLQNVYGPGQSVANSYTGVLTFFAAAASRGEVLDVYEDGRIVRDFVHVLDVVDAFVRAIDTTPGGTRLLDVGSGRPVTIHEAARAIAKAYGAPEPRVSGRFRDGDVRAASCSVEAIAADLGWAPARSFDDGIADLAGWVGDLPAVTGSR
jgi:dTDP-L-rhamnose 4-epimerase